MNVKNLRKFQRIINMNCTFIYRSMVRRQIILEKKKSIFTDFFFLQNYMTHYQYWIQYCLNFTLTSFFKILSILNVDIDVPVEDLDDSIFNFPCLAKGCTI